MSTEHAPRPWTWKWALHCKAIIVRDGKGKVVIRHGVLSPSHTSEDSAIFNRLVAYVNAHDDLLAACKAARKLMECESIDCGTTDAGDTIFAYGVDPEDAQEAAKILDAAIAKTEASTEPQEDSP